MDSELPITYVFLDTSEYVSCNFDYGNSLFQALKARVDAGQALLGITKVTLGEVKSKIHEGILEAKQAIQSARKKAKVFRNCNSDGIRSIFEKLNEDELEKELLGQFEQYLKEFKVEILGYEDINVEKIFSLYFSKKAPFDNTKKKNEFPDAFSLDILNRWAETESSSIYVVSKDNDFKEGVKNFSNLEHVHSLADMLSVLSYRYEELAPLCAKTYEFAKSDIDKLIIENFGARGFYIDDQEGDVDNIFNIEIDEYQPRLLIVDHENENISAEFEVITTISFEAEISYDDLDTASYDSEDKVLIPHFTIEETVSSSETIMVNVSLSFEKYSPTSYKLEEISFNGLSDDVAVSSSRDEGWPYK